MEQLIILLAFLLLSALSTWLSKRRQKDDPDSPPPARPRAGRLNEPTTTSQPRRGVMSEWEDQLRRLLEGESAQSEPSTASSRAEPPVLENKTASRHAPATGRLGQPKTVPASPPPPPIVRVLKSEPPKPIQHSSPPPAPVIEKVRIQTPLPVELTVHLGVPTTRPSDLDKATVIRQLQHARTARQAFIASLIFNPPKALE